ncbi:1297_t:CDS:2 [Funneliformis geosporum]|uniref:1297_t:CDS:1 n=1 Tax=Funneliformis geosporum TaxID=1117311 RepID=A0A9W4SC08_9GLOM|nr:1297_t:CDS:2 [Funneliformis geosporum]
MSIIQRLATKKNELEKRLEGQYSGKSQGKEILQYKIEKLEELITIYGSASPSMSLTNARQMLDQQVGFEEQKKELLEKPKGIRPKPLILCLVGPTGTGKTSFSQIISQALGKKFFSVSLGGLSEISTLVGSEATSPATNMGQLAQALVETKTSDPVILLDEVDKTGLALKNCLLNILDSTQNQSVLDYYLETNENAILNQKNFEITPAAVETLINKTKEKGVRNLKKGLDKKQGKTASKITITPNLVNQIIPLNFTNPEENEPKNDPTELVKISQALAKLQNENEKLASILSESQKELEKLKKNNQDLEGQVKGEEVASEGVLGGLTNFKGLYPWEEKKLIENIILDSTELENTIANFENKLKAIVVGSNEQEVINLRKKKEELRKTLKEKEQQIITLSNHKCDTPEGKELNLWKEKVVELTTEKDKLQKKIKDFELSGDDGENLDNLTPEQLKHKIYNTRKEITKLKSEIGKNNNSNPEGANYGHWILGGMGIADIELEN